MLKKLLGYVGIFALGFGWVSGCQVGYAQDEENPPVTATAADTPVSSTSSEEVGEVPAPVRMHTDRQTMGTDRWENTLDAKLTNLFGREASDVESPTVMLSAAWNRKFRYNTYVGLTVSGLPQSHAKRENGIKTSTTMYYGGLNLAQGIYENKPFRAVVQVSANKGMTYVRTTGEGADGKALDGKAKEYKFTVIEPGLAIMVYEWKHLELGLVGTNRLVKLEKDGDEVVENDKLSSVSYGLTFRTERW